MLMGGIAGRERTVNENGGAAERERAAAQVHIIVVERCGPVAIDGILDAPPTVQPNLSASNAGHPAKEIDEVDGIVEVRPRSSSIRIEQGTAPRRSPIGRSASQVRRQ